MITTYNKPGDEYNNHYGPDDEWFIEEVNGKFYVMAREVGTDEWVLINTARNADGAEKAKSRKLADYADTIRHPNGPMYELVETGTTGHRFDTPYHDPNIIRIRIAPGQFEKREL